MTSYNMYVRPYIGSNIRTYIRIETIKPHIVLMFVHRKCIQ